MSVFDKYPPTPRVKDRNCECFTVRASQSTSDLIAVRYAGQNQPKIYPATGGKQAEQQQDEVEVFQVPNAASDTPC